jgi:hypothetical protein
MDFKKRKKRKERRKKKKKKKKKTPTRKRIFLIAKGLITHKIYMKSFPSMFPHSRSANLEGKFSLNIIQSRHM